MSDHDFCRSMLTDTMKEVRQHTTPKQRKSAWVWFDGHRMGDFHMGSFYYYDRCCCRYDMKAKGWSRWLEKHKHEKALT